MNSFRQLSEKDKKILLDAPPLVMILIAGADGNIDEKEVIRAFQVTKEQAKRNQLYLKEFYEQVEENFTEKFNLLLQKLPEDTISRNKVITKSLSRLNEIFRKTDKTFNITLYASLRNISVEIAKASGGTLGINSISAEELEFLDLPMIKDPSLLFS